MVDTYTLRIIEDIITTKGAEKLKAYRDYYNICLQNIKENIELSELATRFGYSKWHFCSKFRNYTGKSFVKYVRHCRLQLASLDILSGKKSTDIALDYGYETL